MSVQGEFQRIAADAIAFLEGSSDASARELAAALREAASRGAKDVSRGAAEVLDLLAARGRPAFTSSTEREAFERCEDHLTSICRVILGR
jgi:hypothetical protein